MSDAFSSSDEYFKAIAAVRDLNRRLVEYEAAHPETAAIGAFAELGVETSDRDRIAALEVEVARLRNVSREAQADALSRLGAESRSEPKQSANGASREMMHLAYQKGYYAALARMNENCNPFYDEQTTMLTTPMSYGNDAQASQYRDSAVAWYAGWRMGQRKLVRR